MRPRIGVLKPRIGDDGYVILHGLEWEEDRWKLAEFSLA
jgi:hypothetical protein